MTVHRSVRRYGPKRGAHVDPSGYDAGTEVEGKKRHVLVGTLGLLLTAVIHPADVQDWGGVLPVLRAARRLDRHPVERTPGCGGMARTLGRTTRTVPLRVDGVVGRWRGSTRPRVARRLSGRARADSIRVRDARGGPGRARGGRGGGGGGGGGGGRGGRGGVGWKKGRWRRRCRRSRSMVSAAP